jgi:hypothetical protein
MNLKVFDRHELELVLRALAGIAVVNDRFTEGERALLEGVARIHGYGIRADALEPIDFERVAQVLVDPHRRKRAVQLAIVMALVEGKPSVATGAAVQRFARALGIDDAGLRVLREVADGHGLLARMDMFRRVARSIRSADGFPGPLGLALPVLGLGGGDARTAARYRALERCSPGTLGRAFHDHFVVNEFSFPGEVGGIPLRFHDLGHVIAGYGTDPQGEIQQAAFQAGFARNDGFTFLLFGILQFHLALRITPVAKGYSGLFDVERVFTALERGAACKVDLMQGYDIFANQQRSLDEVRESLGVSPLQMSAPGAA